ncbi:MAG: serine/threonine-protein kinase [Lachnospiraceae bacterium]|nr:serine/threonine-protein kinase [Lachnospiraceae bacterium]
MAQVRIGEQKINKGEFYFVSEALGDERLVAPFFEMEEAYWINTEDFYQKMRRALELVAHVEDIRLWPEDGAYSSEGRLKKMGERLKKEAEGNAYLEGISGTQKLFFLSRCCSEDSDVFFFRAAVNAFVGDKYVSIWTDPMTGEVLAREQRRCAWKLRRLILDLYNVTSRRGAHVEIGASEDGPDAQSENQGVRRLRDPEVCLKAFYYLMRGYCEKYYPDAFSYKDVHLKDLMHLPIRDYLPVNKATRKELGLKPVTGKRYYVREDRGQVRYYLLFEVEAGRAENREVDILRKLWEEDNDRTPDAIIKFREEIHLNNGSSHLVFSLPSAALALSRKFLAGRSVTEKEKLFEDALDAVSFLHNSEPPLYHRDIWPGAFLVCRVKNRYKLFLEHFDCVKDTTAGYTEYAKVRKNEEKTERGPYIAPERLGSQDSPEHPEAWEKADLYSLGKLGLYILTGGTDLKDLDLYEQEAPGCVARIRTLCSENPEDRGSLSEEGSAESFDPGEMDEEQRNQFLLQLNRMHRPFQGYEFLEQDGVVRELGRGGFGYVYEGRGRGNIFSNI